MTSLYVIPKLWRSMFKSGRLAVGIALLALWAVAAWAEQNRVLQGQVLDQDGHAVPGAVVQIKNRSTYWIRSYITQADGRYHFAELYGDVTYQVHATYMGVSSRTRGLSKFSARAVATIDLVIDLSHESDPKL
jgi:carboxypeptidase family protein